MRSINKRCFLGLIYKTLLTLILFIAISFAMSNISSVHAIENEVTYTGLQSNIYGDDGHSGGAKGPFDIGFDFTLFDTAYTGSDAKVNININGALTFGPYYTTFTNTPFNNGGQDNTIYPFWDDLTCYSDDNNSIYYATIGDAPNRKFVTQWTNVYFYGTEIQMGTFQAILYEGSNDVQLQYRDLLGGSRALGDSATIGIRKNSATYHQYSYDTASLTEGQAIRYSHDGISNYTVNTDADYDPIYLVPAGAPTSPTLVNPANNTTGVTTSPTFEWLPVDSADSYILLISTRSDFATTVINQSDITDTAYTLGSNLDADTQYYWRVQSVNEIGSSLSATRIFTTTSTENTVPDVPTYTTPSAYVNGDTITQSQLASQSLSLNLNDSDEDQDVRYRIQISKQSDFSSLVIDYRSTFGSPGSRSFTLGESGGTYLLGDQDTVLDTEANYYIRLRAEDEAAASSDWAGPSGVAFVISEILPNAIPVISNLGPTNIINGSQSEDKTPTFTFSVSDEDDDPIAYRLQVSNDGDFSNLLIDYTSGFSTQTNRSFTVGSPAGEGSYSVGSENQELDNGEYYWRVKAIDDNTNESDYLIANNGYVAFEVSVPDDDGDGIATNIENDSPNDGDANKDDIPDGQQINVASLVNPITNEYSVLEVDESCNIESVSIIAEESNSKKDSGYTYNNGIVNFTADCVTPGYKTTVKIYHYGAPSDNLLVRKYDTNDNIYFTIDDANIDHTIIDSREVTVASFTVTDGGALDMDREENGTIVDPVGLASTTDSLAETGDNFQLVVIAAVSLISLGLFTSLSTRIRRKSL